MANKRGELPVRIKQARRAHPIRYLASSTLILAGAYGALLLSPYTLLITGIGAILALHKEAHIRNHFIEVDHNKVTSSRGVWTRHAYTIYYDDIMDMKVKQTILERILNIGNVYVNNPSYAKHAFYAEKVPNPHAVCKLIEHMEHEYALTRHKKEPQKDRKAELIRNI